ncbi:MAG: UDP-N-acetylglucosamine--LPS N-acetylglucosamine transferase [Thalassolituus sp.]
MANVHSRTNKPRVLAVASGGGHWKQLLRLRPVFERYDTTYVTTIDGLPQEAGITQYKVIGDCSRDSLYSLVRAILQVLSLIVRVRPKIIISTGAAPGLLAIAMGRMICARTLWIDSIANGDQLSMSGRIARRLAHQTISQWQGVAADEKVGYWGQLL